MTEHDELFFQNLLTESREACLEFELPRKDEILVILQGHADVFDKIDTMNKQLNTMKKKNIAKEEMEPIEKKISALEGQAKLLPSESRKAILPMLTDDVRLDLETENFKVHSMKCAILHQAGPKDLALFCQSNSPSLIMDLLDNDDLMKEMLFNGGATKGKYAEAYQLFDQLMEEMESGEFSDCHRRLALATALELADPITVFGTNSHSVDPVKRFLHYVDAHKRGELDPVFPYFTVWEYRHVVNSNATDAELQWGRDHIKRYRPDFATSDNMKWRYCQLVKTDVGYRKPSWPGGRHTYQQLLSGGGKCGPRAWFGRFMAKAFGIPTWGVKQPGHAAMSRWTPAGWDTILGAGLQYSHWDGRNGLDFKFEAHARLFQIDSELYFHKVTLLECMAVAHKNDSFRGKDANYLSPKCVWSSLVRLQRQAWCQDAATCKSRLQRGPEKGSDPDTLIGQYIARVDTPKDDHLIQVLGDGRVRIPACALVKNKGALLHKSFEGGGQLHLEHGKESTIEYKLPVSVPKKQYSLCFKICTVHLEQNNATLGIDINDGESKIEAKVHYTIGEWEHTKPTEIHVGGDDMLKITNAKGSFRGLTFREMILTPI